MSVHQPEQEMTLDILRDQLDAELELWRNAGLSPRFFLRDDDAIDDTQALVRLDALVREHDIPLLLAVIPDPAQPALAARLANSPLITPAVHGFRHVSHSPKGEKVCELGTHRPVDDVLDELAKGREKLRDLFAREISAILVPPWNRIHDAVRDRIGDAGFAAVSAHGWSGAAPVKMINAHIDVIHWKGGRKGRDLVWVHYNLLRNLETARQRGGEPVGILLHHLDHDEQAWLAIESIFDWTRKNPAIKWMAADDLI
ncbi:MAG: polysaccharide deacetylase family protein [Nitratireductor sp.]|nr:polysaccharide deacetylase family protein [Nitratireductor sp.]